MPELPEVEVVRAGLNPAVTGATVESVTVYDARSLRRHPGPTEDFVDRLVGRGIRTASRRGKFLWMPLVEPGSDEIAPGDVARSAPGPLCGSALVMHLGMSGQVLLRDRGTDDPRTRVRIDFVHPRLGALRLNFVDQRIFGSLAIDGLLPVGDADRSAVAQLVPRSVAHIARDPLDPLFDDRAFLSKLSRRDSAIKRALLDQNLISGIGNIYADEALWAARVHYEQRASTLTRPRARALLAQVRLVLAKALAEGGTSFDAQYVNVNGASGYFAHSLNAYGQQGNPCPRCGRPIVRERFMNRGSHLCPHCQRLR